MATRKYSHKRLTGLYELHDLLTAEGGKQNPIACWFKDLPASLVVNITSRIQYPNCTFVVLDEKAFVEALNKNGRGATSFANKCRTLNNWCFSCIRMSNFCIFISRQPHFNVGNRRDIEKMVSIAPSISLEEREKRAKENVAQF